MPPPPRSRTSVVQPTGRYPSHTWYSPPPQSPHLSKHALGTLPTAPNRYSPLYRVRRAPSKAPHPLAQRAVPPGPLAQRPARTRRGSAAPSPPDGRSPVFDVRPLPPQWYNPPPPPPQGQSHRPRAATPTPSRKGGAQGPRSPPGGRRWYGPGRLCGGWWGVRTRPSRRGGALGDTRWRTHLSPPAAQPRRRGSPPAHRHAALDPPPYVSWRRRRRRRQQRWQRLRGARPNGSRGAAPPPPPPSPRLPPPPTLWTEIPPSPATNRN